MNLTHYMFSRIGLGTALFGALFVLLGTGATHAQTACTFTAALDVDGQTHSITITAGDTVSARLRAQNTQNCDPEWRHRWDWDFNTNPGWDEQAGLITSTQNTRTHTYTAPGTYVIKGDIRNGSASQGDTIVTVESNTVTVIVEADTPPPPPPQACNPKNDVQPVGGTWPVIGSGATNIDFISGNRATIEIENVSSNCTHDVRLASYEVFDLAMPAFIQTQQLFQTRTVRLSPGEVGTLTVDLPVCATQVDLFTGGPTPQTNPDFANLPGYTLYDAATARLTQAQLCGEDPEEPEVEIEKSVTPGSGLVNQVTFTFTLNYANAGSVAVPNATIEDVATPANILGPITITQQPAHGSCTPNSAGITCNLGTLQPGASGQVRYIATGVVVGTSVNEACINGTGVDEVCDSASVVVFDNPPQANAECVSFTANPTTINQGGTSVLSWVTRNAARVSIDNGIGNVTPVANGSYTVRPGIPTRYTLSVYDAQNNLDDTCVVTVQVNQNGLPYCTMEIVDANVGVGQSTGRVRWTSGGGVQTVSINNGIGSGLPLNGTSPVQTVTQTTVYTGTFSGSFGEITCDATLTVLPPQQGEADVAITKLVNGQPQATGPIGTEFTYTLRYSNEGKTPAENVTISDVPEPFGGLGSYTLVSGPQHGSCTTALRGGAILSCTLGTLAPGAQGTITYRAVGNNPGTVDNTARIQTTTNETNLANNEDDARVIVYTSDFADVTIEKFVRNANNRIADNVSDTASGIVGDSFIYTLEYRNAGFVGAINTSIVDILTPGTRIDNVTIINDGGNTCTVDNNEIECVLGNLLVGESGMIQYRVDAIAAGVVDNTATIYTSTDETPAPTGLLPNSDDARITVREENSDDADAAVTKNVSPKTGEVDDVFTYTLRYENVSNQTVRNVVLDDSPDQEDELDDFDIVSTPSGVTCAINRGGEGFRCDLGDLLPGESGTITYTARARVEGTIDNTVILTADNDSDPDNNEDDERIVIDNDDCTNCGGGGGGGNGGGRRGGGSRRTSDPDITLFERPTPQVLGTVSLNQVPYTGVGDVVAVLLFFGALLAAAGFIAYVVLKKRGNAPARPRLSGDIFADDGTETGTVHISRGNEASARAGYTPIAPPIPGMARPETAAAPQSKVVAPPTNIPTEGIDLNAELEEYATRHKALLSGEARKMIIAQANNDPAALERVMNDVVTAAKERFPREDGWLLLNQSRVAQVLMKQGMSTIPLFISWMLAGNEKQLFAFLRNLSTQGTAPEHFIRQVIAELDAVYQARLDNVRPDTDPEISSQLKDVPMHDLEMIITGLTRSLDGRYSSPLDGVKVALTRIMSHGNARMGGE